MSATARLVHCGGGKERGVERMEDDPDRGRRDSQGNMVKKDVPKSIHAHEKIVYDGEEDHA